MLSKQKQILSKQNGFTIVELLVAISITTFLSVVMVSFIVQSLSQTAISSIRSALTSTAQTALVRVSTDIRNSVGVTTSNQVVDASAPSGGDWVSSDTTLVLASRAVKNDGSMYTSSLGAYDFFAYYVKDTVLYKRIIAYPDVSNRYQTVSCGVTTLGGCPSDTAIARNVTGLSFEYFTKDGSVTLQPILAASVRTNITIQTTQSGQVIKYADSATMAPRVLTNLPANAARVSAGWGGIRFLDGAIVNGGVGTTLYSAGGMLTGQYVSIGSVSTPISRIDVLNRGCGVGAAFGSSCAPSEPLTVNGSSAAWGVISGGRVCAANQVSNNAAPAYDKTAIYGLVSACPVPTSGQPLFNKAAHTAKMINPTTGSRSCSSLSGCTGLELPGLTKYAGDVTANGALDVQLRGDIYITGNLTLGNTGYGQTRLIVDPALTERPVVMVNGRIALDSMTVVSSSGLLPIFISFYSLDATKSMSDSYVNQDPQTIYNAVNTYYSAVSIGNNGIYDGTFYAYFGKLSIGLSTTVDGTVAGQKIEVGYNSTLNLRPYTWLE